MSKSKHIDSRVIKFFEENLEIDYSSFLEISTSNPKNLVSIFNLKPDLKFLYNSSPLNNVRYTNKFLEQLNNLHTISSLYSGCFLDKDDRKNIILGRRIYPLNYLFYYMDVIFNRIFPRLKFFKKIFYFVTRGRRKVFSKAEVLGRLISCGYSIISCRKIGFYTYFIVKKIKEPYYDSHPSYGPIFKMKRVGKNAKIFNVYKFRTMHPYSEYLHDYILKKSGYSETGKPAEDFRVTSWGRFLRRYWLDELPQIINLLSLEMKLVGIRPVSERYLNDIPKDLKEKRLKHKPGCIPPYVCLNMKSNLESVFKAEEIYLKQYAKHHIFTDIKFFFKALYNILVKRKRSA